MAFVTRAEQPLGSGPYGQVWQHPWQQNKEVAASSSYTWRSILFGYKALEERLIWRIGNGKAAPFWKDKWLEDAPLASCVVRPLDQAELGKSIHDYWLQTNDWDWGVLRQYLPDATLSKLSGILALGHSETQDKLLWKHSSKGDFSIKSVYSQLLQGAGFACGQRLESILEIQRTNTCLLYPVAGAA
jgi:hypothetical protein